jgi:hypothetical protein
MEWTMIVEDDGSNGWMLKFVRRHERQKGNGLGGGRHFDKSRCCASYVHCYKSEYRSKSWFSRGKQLHMMGVSNGIFNLVIYYVSSAFDKPKVGEMINDPLWVWFVGWVQISTGFRWYELQKTCGPRGPWTAWTAAYNCTGKALPVEPQATTVEAEILTSLPKYDTYDT